MKTLISAIALTCLALSTGCVVHARPGRVGYVGPTWRVSTGVSYSRYDDCDTTYDSYEVRRRNRRQRCDPPPPPACEDVYYAY